MCVCERERERSGSGSGSMNIQQNYQKIVANLDVFNVFLEFHI